MPKAKNCFVWCTLCHRDCIEPSSDNFIESKNNIYMAYIWSQNSFKESAVPQIPMLVIQRLLPAGHRGIILCPLALPIATASPPPMAASLASSSLSPACSTSPWLSPACSTSSCLQPAAPPTACLPPAAPAPACLQPAAPPPVLPAYIDSHGLKPDHSTIIRPFQQKLFYGF